MSESDQITVLSSDDDPFKEPPPGRSHRLACIERDGCWYPQVNGFFLASARLIEHVLSGVTDEIENDSVIFPILSLPQVRQGDEALQGAPRTAPTPKALEKPGYRTLPGQASVATASGLSTGYR